MKNEPLTEADQTLDRSLLPAAPRRAHLDAHADVDDGVRERRIERLDIASFAALLHDGARAIEDGHQRQTAERDEVPRETAHDRLDALVVDDRDGDESRVLQSRSKEVNALLATVDEAHVDVSEVVL